MSRRKYLVFLVPVASIFFFFLAGEIAIRAWHFVRWDISLLQGQPKDVGGLSSIVVDTQLGWRPTPGFRFAGEKLDYKGVKYAVNISQDDNGFRAFGNPASGKLKVLTIGDSFTQAVEVSDDKTYWAVVQKLLDVEMFAYGGGGFGSLQEFMILDKFYDSVKPDLIIWQYSTNDVINNLAELELASRINNNGLLRPYWVNGEINYVLPRRRGATLQRATLKYCRLCYIILNRLDRLEAMRTEHTVEMDTKPDGPAHATFMKSVAVTNDIMGMVRERARTVPIVSFTVGKGDPYGPEYIDSLTEISRRHDITVLPDVEEAVLVVERRGTNVRAADGAHWNETGHEIAGRALADALRQWDRSTAGQQSSRFQE
jgi:hypothetical protein